MRIFLTVVVFGCLVTILGGFVEQPLNILARAGIGALLAAIAWVLSGLVFPDDHPTHR